MTMTPWGESEQLRDLKLQPGPGVAKEDLERNQRGRLFGATVAVVAEQGYGQTTVSDLTELAGMSRSGFYRYFPDKEACFLATLKLLVAGVLAVTKSGLRGDRPLDERAENGLAAFVDLLVAQPAAARVCVVEAEAAGPTAAAIVDDAVAEFALLMSAVFDELPQQRGMPPEIVSAMAGGVRKILHTRLLRGTEGELVDLVPNLVRLGLSYRPPPGPIPDRKPRRMNVPRSPSTHGFDEPSERLERAAMNVTAEYGYADASMASFATEAGASLRTLYATFTDKQDLFEAAFLRSRLRLTATVLPAFRRGPDWPAGITAAVRASLSFLETEAAFARLITRDVSAAGAASLESRERALEAGRHLIEASSSYQDLGNPIAAEAIIGSVFSLISSRVRSEGSTELQSLAPLATYIILAPFLGTEEAYRHSLEGRDGGDSAPPGRPPGAMPVTRTGSTGSRGARAG